MLWWNKIFPLMVEYRATTVLQIYCVFNVKSLQLFVMLTESFAAVEYEKLGADCRKHSLTGCKLNKQILKSQRQPRHLLPRGVSVPSQQQRIECRPLGLAGGCLPGADAWTWLLQLKDSCLLPNPNESGLQQRCRQHGMERDSLTQKQKTIEDTTWERLNWLVSEHWTPRFWPARGSPVPTWKPFLCWRGPLFILFYLPVLPMTTGRDLPCLGKAENRGLVSSVWTVTDSFSARSKAVRVKEFP